MKSILVLLAIFVASEARCSKSLWESYKINNQKLFTSKQLDSSHQAAFYENYIQMMEHNEMYKNGLTSFKLGINKFADIPHNDFTKYYNGYKKNQSLKNTFLNKFSFIPPANVQLPDEVDWRTQGAVTLVKDQGQCGSCWSFSATGSLEGQHFRKTGQLVLLSEQNLVDCSGGEFGNHGCSGGLMDNAFNYIKDNGGIDTEDSYPYHASESQCQYNKNNKGASVQGFVDIEKGNEEKLKAAVATVGPISVAIDASQRSFQIYDGGVYYDEDCNSENLDHAVLVVGYGTDNDGNDYWLVKNSWSDGWGENGYIKMARNKNNHCGIASEASYPIV